MSSSHISIPLVEDDETDIIAAKRSLNKRGIGNPLYVARDGVEALAILRSSGQNGGGDMPHPCIVLLDINLPRMGGLEFLREIRRDPRLCSTMIIITTGTDDKSAQEAVQTLNVVNYFTKPLNFDQIIEMILNLEQAWNIPETAGSQPAQQMELPA